MASTTQPIDSLQRAFVEESCEEDNFCYLFTKHTIYRGSHSIYEHAEPGDILVYCEGRIWIREPIGSSSVWKLISKEELPILIKQLLLIYGL